MLPWPLDRDVTRAHSLLPAWATVATAWSLYLPLGWQYLAFFGGAMTAMVLWLRRGTPMPAMRSAWWPLALSWWAWMFLSMAWSSAPLLDQAVHLWHYALPICLLPLAAATSSAAARQAMRHFVIISVIVSVLLPWLLADRITGNQRIVYSLLLAVAVAFAIIEALTSPAPRQRALWSAAAIVCTLGLVLQDRRSGMLALPLMLFVLALARQSSLPRRLALMAALSAATLMVWHTVEPLRTRFEQGLAEMQAYRSSGDVATSIGMRWRMVEVTLDMIRERPLAGHGVGSWRAQWRERVRGGELLQAHTTPHNEYLLVAQQGGAIGLALFVAALVAGALALWRRGAAGHAALLVWVAFAFAALFNAALRDAKIALPLLLLGALAWASARDAEPRA